MQIDYAKDGITFERAIKLIDHVFPGAKDMVAQGKELGAFWEEASQPFLIEKNNQFIAHLGVVPIDITLANKPQHLAILHGVCVQPKYRGQGYFKQLMKEALPYLHKNFDASLLFTDNPELYIPFGYQICPQYDFLVPITRTASDNPALRPLYLQQPEDLALFNRLYKNRIPLTVDFDISHRILYLFNSLEMKLFYAKTLDAIIVCKAHKKLYLQDILSSHELSFNEIVSVLPHSYNEVILQFYPGKWLDISYETLPAKTKGVLMACSHFSANETTFRWNEMARC